jgi:hypothetical protein
LVGEAGKNARFGNARDEGDPMKRFVFLCTAGVGVVLPACGSLDSNTNSAPTLATLQGSVLNPKSLDISTSSAVRVAVVWRGGIGGSEQQFSVAEDLPVQPVFPSAFTIAFTSPPPAAAMNAESAAVPVIWCVPDAGIPLSPLCALLDGGGASTGAGAPPCGLDAGLAPCEGVGAPPLSGPDAQGVAESPNGDNQEAGARLPPMVPPLDTPTNASPEGQYAVGTVVAYLDNNHNGKLDLVAEDASAYVDQIIAANQDMSIVYLQGPISNGLPPFSIGGPLSVPALAYLFTHPPTDGYHIFLNPQCDWPSPVTNPLCPSAPPAQDPSPSDPSVCCASDGSDYLYTTCAEISRGICQGNIESCTSAGYGRPTPVPAAWPCTK